MLLYRTDLAEQHVFDKFIKASDDGIDGTNGSTAAAGGHIISSTSPPVSSQAVGNALNHNNDGSPPRHMSGIRGTVLAGGDNELLRDVPLDGERDRNGYHNNKGKSVNAHRPEATL